MRESKFKNYMDRPLLLLAPEVGEVLRISRSGAYELVRNKGFPKVKIGNRIVIPKDRCLVTSPQVSRWTPMRM